MNLQNIEGKITYAKAYELLNKYYSQSNINIEKSRNERECDLVSLRIAQILESKSFKFSPLTLKNIHGFLFKDIYDFAGEYREYNITKKEDILNGDTVKYVDFKDVENYLGYDFEKESNFDYSKLSLDEFIFHIAKFVSSIWQIHPFGEGNTKTTAVFIQKYLNSLGFDVNNDSFKDNSIYFRNSLVFSNYANIPKGIYPKFDYLNMFFKNILQGKKYELNNNELYIK